MTKPLRVAIAGLGTVGGGVVKVLTARRTELAARAGREIECVLVSARDRRKKRAAEIGNITWTDDCAGLAASDADVIVELIGGESGVAYALVERALQAGKHVVTANKALLAYHGAELAALAEEKGVVLRFEGAAAGGIPIVKALRESLIAYDIASVRGILNGTCNYILTQMEASGRPFADILADAQRLGFAEADPTLDVGGGDTAHKLALLASLAFGIKPDLDNIPIQGISHITPQDIAFAREFGCRIKLLGIARRVGDRFDQRVQPAMVRLGTPLADVDGAFNAVVAHAGEAGPFFFEGRGAGEAPTASAVVADIVDIARGNASPVFGRPAATLRAAVPALSHSLKSAFYLRFDVLDAPGVLAEIASHLAQSEISIESMIQRGRAPGEPVSIVMITHECSHEAVVRALKVIAASDRVLGAPCMIPMEAG
ncbi:MAG TPA: homoserine dehydrogenase [Rhizomicrobium sp.]|nr:homoserine dehydrogenase [Rhizomicrobium sp.]